MSDKIEYAYNYIKAKILDNTFKPSQRLVETQLAEMIGVSRNTIKQALWKLEKEKLVIVEKNKGAYINNLELDEVLNILEIREVLEGLIVRATVNNITEVELKELESILVDMKSCLESNDFDGYTKLNSRFHNIIYDASNKHQAVELVRTIKTQLIRYQYRTTFISGRTTFSYKEHMSIFEAIKRQDPEDAEKAIRTHVSNVRKTIKDYYQFVM